MVRHTHTPIKVTSILDGTVQIFNDTSRKNHSSPVTPICPVFVLVSPICQNTDKLHYSPVLSLPICSHMLTHRWPKISSLVTGLPKTPLESSLHSTDPSQTDDSAAGAHPVQLVPSVLIPDCASGAQIMVTLPPTHIHKVTDCPIHISVTAGMRITLLGIFSHLLVCSHSLVARNHVKLK